MKPSARRKAREFILQAIYQWQFTGDPVTTVEAHFYDAIQKTKGDFVYFTRLLHGIVENCAVLDETVTPFLDRDLKDLNPVELAILRFAVYELKFCLDIPYKVIINEALEVTKNFGSTEGFKYVNGVLDKVAREVRKDEEFKN